MGSDVVQLYHKCIIVPEKRVNRNFTWTSLLDFARTDPIKAPFSRLRVAFYAPLLRALPEKLQLDV